MNKNKKIAKAKNKRAAKRKECAAFTAQLPPEHKCFVRPGKGNQKYKTALGRYGVSQLISSTTVRDLLNNEVQNG